MLTWSANCIIHEAERKSTFARTDFYVNWIIAIANNSYNMIYQLIW